MRIEVSAGAVIVECRVVRVRLVVAGVIGALLIGRWCDVMRIWVGSGAIAAS